MKNLIHISFQLFHLLGCLYISSLLSICRGSHWRCSVKKNVNLFLVFKKLFLACNFIKKRLQHRCFPVKFAKFLRALILQNICKWLLLYLHCSYLLSFIYSVLFNILLGKHVSEAVPLISYTENLYWNFFCKNPRKMLVIELFRQYNCISIIAAHKSGRYCWVRV